MKLGLDISRVNGSLIHRYEGGGGEGGSCCVTCTDWKRYVKPSSILGETDLLKGKVK